MRGSQYSLFILFVILILFHLMIGCGENYGLERGKKLLKDGDNAAAVEAFVSVLKRNPNHSEAHYRLGIAYGELERYNEAITELEKAEQLEPKRTEITFALGRMYWITDRQKEAIECFLRIIRNSPNPTQLQEIAGLTGDAFKVKCLTCEDATQYSKAFSVEGKVIPSISKYADDYGATFSPDGKQVAFVSYRLKNAEIYLINTEDKTLTQLTHSQAVNEQMPAFSPDGKLIAFVAEQNVSGEAQIIVQSSGSTSSDASIYLMDIKRKNLSRLTDATVAERAPTFSPDGQKIAFESIESSGEDDLEIFVVNVDGTNKKQLTFNDVDDGHPAFSPDGKQIVFTSFVEDNFEIYLIDIDDGKLRRLTRNNFGDYQPAFSPDGKRIIFVSNQNDGYELCMMNADGTNRKQLTSSIGVNLEPSFSPDGNNVLFSSDRTGYMRIYIMDLTQPFQAEELQNRLNQLLAE